MGLPGGSADCVIIWGSIPNLRLGLLGRIWIEPAPSNGAEDDP